jgi:CO/xanthine dehydrogenase FAD-binding subunit
MDVLRPRSLEEALAMKTERPEAGPIAGGTDVMVELNFGRSRPRAMIDLSHLPELRGWRAEDGALVLGAAATYAEILRGPGELDLLARASRTVGSPQIRNRGTVGGNLGTASPAGDALPVLAVHEADIVLASARGTRSLPWDEFLVGPKRTAIRDDELIVTARWPLRRHVGTFSKVGTRNAMVIAVASLALLLDEDGREVRVALGSVGPTVLRAPEAEAFAASALAEAGVWEDPRAPLRPEVFAEFGALTAAASRPIDDVRGTAAYRRRACEVLGARALRWLVERRAATPVAA